MTRAWCNAYGDLICFVDSRGSVVSYPQSVKNPPEILTHRPATERAEKDAA